MERSSVGGGGSRAVSFWLWLASEQPSAAPYYLLDGRQFVGDDAAPLISSSGLGGSVVAVYSDSAPLDVAHVWSELPYDMWTHVLMETSVAFDSGFVLMASLLSAYSGRRRHLSQTNHPGKNETPPSLCPRVAVCRSNGSILNHATAQMNHKLVHQAAFPSAFNRGSRIEPSIETLPRVHTRSVRRVSKRHSALLPNQRGGLATVRVTDRGSLGRGDVCGVAQGTWREGSPTWPYGAERPQPTSGSWRRGWTWMRCRLRWSYHFR